MKKLIIISAAIFAMTMMVSCKHKAQTVPDDSTDSVTVANDSIIEKVDTTPKPMFIYVLGTDNMMMCYWEDSDSLQKAFHRNAALYNKLLADGGKLVDIKYVDEQLKNPDGQFATYGELHSIKEIPATGMRYAFTDAKYRPRDMRGMYLALTDSYLASRKLVEMKPLQSDKPLPATVVKQLEDQYKMKAQRSLLVSKGGSYSYGILQFRGKYRTDKEFGQKVDKCLALEVIMDGDKVWSYPVEGYIYGGEPSWNADDDGEYFPSSVTLFEAPDNTLEVAYVHLAPESCTVGMFYIRDGQMTRQRYTVYHSMIDEELPLWKKDIAQLQKLYVAKNPQENKGYQFCKYRWLDIDGDGQQEIWLRAEDDKHGAFFTHDGNQFRLIATEDGDMTPVFRDIKYADGAATGYLTISSSAPGAFYDVVYEVRKSKVVHTVTLHQLYAEMTDCTYDGKEMSTEDGQRYLDALPKVTEYAIWWREFTLQ